MVDSTLIATPDTTTENRGRMLAAALHEYRETLRKSPAGPLGSPASTEPFGAFAVDYLARHGLAVRSAAKPVAGIDPARFVNQVHAQWSAVSTSSARATFGEYLLERLDRAGYTLYPTPLVDAYSAPAPAAPTAPTVPQRRPTDLYPIGPGTPIPAGPHWKVAVGMTVGEVSDLLAALDKRGLTWTRGTDGQAGRLDDGPAEPDDLHVVFDQFRGAWQRDDDEAGPKPERWFRAGGSEALTWRALWQGRGPVTPDAGVAPAPLGDDGCEGGTR